MAKAEELAATETVAEVAEAVEEPEVTETVLEQRPEMDAISTELPAKIKFGPTPTEPIVEAEELPEETPSNAGKRIKAVLYSALGLAIVGSAIFVTYNWMHSRGNLVVQLLYRLHLASHLLLLNQVAVKHRLKNWKSLPKPTMPFL